VVVTRAEKGTDKTVLDAGMDSVPLNWTVNGMVFVFEKYHLDVAITLDCHRS
jgi:hypothetical protein